MELLKEDIQPKKRSASLLRRLSSNLSLKSWKSEDETPKTKDSAQKNQLPSAHSAHRTSPPHRQETQRQPKTFGFMAVPPRWTPPLSPSSKSTKHSSSFSAGDKENGVLSPRGALKVLNSPGVPPLDDLRQMRTLVGAASRTWLRDFLIRGGRRCVNAKVSEMAALEEEAKKRPRKVALIPKVFGRKSSSGNDKDRGKGNGKGKGGLLPRPTLREISEAREELMKLVVFLHLRE